METNIAGICAALIHQHAPGLFPKAAPLVPPTSLRVIPLSRDDDPTYSIRAIDPDQDEGLYPDWDPLTPPYTVWCDMDPEVPAGVTVSIFDPDSLVSGHGLISRIR